MAAVVSIHYLGVRVKLFSPASFLNPSNSTGLNALAKIKPWPNSNHYATGPSPPCKKPCSVPQRSQTAENLAGYMHPERVIDTGGFSGGEQASGALPDPLRLRGHRPLPPIDSRFFPEMLPGGISVPGFFRENLLSFQHFLPSWPRHPESHSVLSGHGDQIPNNSDCPATPTRSSCSIRQEFQIKPNFPIVFNNAVSPKPIASKLPPHTPSTHLCLTKTHSYFIIK